MNPLSKEYDVIYTRKEHYREHYDQSPYKRIWSRVISYINIEDRVLELGCGTGQMMEMLLDRGVKEYVGYDFSQVAIDLAFSRIQGRNARLCYQDLYEIDKLSDADVYVAVEVFEHLKDDADQRLLKLIPKGKKIIITVPSYLGGSHVRKFSNKQEIIDRYSDISIKEVVIIGNTEAKIFIVFAEKK